MANRSMIDEETWRPINVDKHQGHQPCPNERQPLVLDYDMYDENLHGFVNRQNSLPSPRHFTSNINVDPCNSKLYLDDDRDIKIENNEEECDDEKDDNVQSKTKVHYHHNHMPLDKTSDKILAFVCICLLGFGSYFSYDSVAALQPHFLTDMKISTIQFMLFNSVSQWSNVICSFLCGILIDNIFGLKRSGIIFASAALIGQIIFTVSISNNLYYTALLGRFILGLGTDSLATIQNAYTVHFYDSRNLNFLFGIHLTSLRMGSVLALNIQETLYEFFGKTLDLHGYKLLGFTINISTLFVLLSTICSILLYFMHGKHEDRQKYKVIENEFKSPDIKLSTKNFSKSLIQEVFNNLISIDFKIWHIVAVLIFFYNGISPFSSLAVFFLKKKYSVSGGQAGSIISSVDFTSAICAPFIGIITDKFKNNVYISQIGIIFSIIGMVLLNFTYIRPIFCIIIIGLGFSSISSSLWPFINISVPKRKLGIVNGTISSVQALVLGVVVLISGHVVESRGYFIDILFNVTNLYLALVLNSIFIQRYGKGFEKNTAMKAIDNNNNNEHLLLMQNKMYSNNEQPMHEVING